MATSMFAADSGAGTPALAEMNVTPLVDVMLVLLIIFMVVAPIATRSLELTLPQRPDARTEPPRHLSLGVRADGQFTLDGVALSERGLAEALGNAARLSPDAVVEVRVSGEADYQAFTTALATARRSGLRHLALQHEEPAAR